MSVSEYYWAVTGVYPPALTITANYGFFDREIHAQSESLPRFIGSLSGTAKPLRAPGSLGSGSTRIVYFNDRNRNTGSFVCFEWCGGNCRVLV